MTDKQLYVEQVKEWLNEQQYREQELIKAIETIESIKQSNVKQLELHRQRINICLDEFNSWAQQNGELAIYNDTPPAPEKLL